MKFNIKLSYHLITGASSLIGRTLCKRLVDNNEFVIAIVRQNSPNRLLLQNHANLLVLEINIEDISEYIPDYIKLKSCVHFAWGGTNGVGRNDIKIQDKNFSMSKLIFEFASSRGSSVFVGAGTQAEYGPTVGKITEDSHCKPITEYGKTKLKFTNYLLERSNEIEMKCYMPRIFSVYGPGDKEWTFTQYVIDCYTNNKVPQLSGCKQIWNFLYIDDLIDLYMNFIKGDIPCGIYNVSNNESLVLKDYAELIRSTFKNGLKPKYNDKKDSNVYSLDVSNKKICSALKWSSAVSFLDGIGIIKTSKGLKYE